MAIERQHYVPQGFLKGFSALDQKSEKLIWMYDKRYDKPAKLVSTKSIAWHSFYYEQETEDGERDTDSLEKIFAETLDNFIPTIIRNLEPTHGSVLKLSPEDKGVLAYFFGLSLTRVPSFRAGVNNFYTKIARATLEVVAKNDPVIAEGLEKYGVNVKAKEWVSLRPMLEIAYRISESCLNKEWQFFIPHESIHFVTSDNPVHFSLPKENGVNMVGPGHPAAELIVHLRRDLAVVCTPPQTGADCLTFKLNKQDSKRFNAGMVRAANVQVYASEKLEGLSKLVKKYKNKSQAFEV